MTENKGSPEAPSWERHVPARLSPEEVDVSSDGTLVSAWLRRWEEAPSRPALFDPREGWVSGAQLEERSRDAAAHLSREGMRKGDRLIVSASPSASLVAYHLGALRLGLIVVPMNTGLTEREVAVIAADAQPSGAFLEDSERAAWIEQVAGKPCHVFPPSNPPRDSAAREVLDQVSPEDPALLCYTSGTTGSPKGALLTHANILAGVESVRIAWRWGREDRLLLALPLFHVHGLGVGLHGTFLAGASVVLVPKFDPGALLDSARDHRATLFFGVPTMYARLAASPRAAELEPLRLCVSGSAPLPVELFRRIEEIGKQTVLERYGMTETLMNVSNPYEGERRPGTVGFPLPGVLVKLGDSSEILLKGPNVFPGYWRRPDATAAAFDAEGWFRTGDIGEFDGDGYLKIVGRSKDVIITGGYNVYPREVEDVLRGHPAVDDVAVVGTESDEWGEAVTAFIVAEGTASAEELIEFASRQLAPYKIPKVVRFVDSLPKNALGKVLADELRRSV